jgi:hypothetical protein
MHKQLATAFARAEKDRKAMLDLLENVPEQTLLRQRHGKWSPSQIISHLILSEMISLQYMKKKVLGIAESGSTGVWAEIKYGLLILSQYVPLKYKAPKVLAESEPESLPYDELKLRWNGTRKDFENFLEKFDHRYLKKKVFKHPSAGRLNIVHAIGFIRAHVNHHLPQIKNRIR